MKNKILFISLAVLLALSVNLVGCGPSEKAAPTAIIVGLARDMDVWLSFFECNAAGPVYRWFVNKVNAAGGIHLSAYDTSNTECWVPINLVVKDFDVQAWDVANVTEKLIITDHADFIWGGPGTDCIYAQAPVCNLYGKLLFTLEGGASSMIWCNIPNGWPYVFVDLSFANWYQIPVVWQMLKDFVATPKAWITYIGGLGADYGLELMTETKNVFGAGNVTDDVPHSDYLTAGESDAIIDRAAKALNSTPYDIFCAYTYPWNIPYLIASIQAYNNPSVGGKFNPPAILFGPGANFNSFSNVYFGDAVDGMLCFATANNKTVPNVGTPTMSMASMFNNLTAQIESDWLNSTLPCPQPAGFTSGAEQLDWWGMPCYMAGLEMWKNAVEAAGDINSVAVRNALIAFNSTNPAQTVFGNTWYKVFGNGYGGGVLDYMCHTGEIGQWQDGYCEIVGYSNINTTPNISPDPSPPLENYDITATINSTQPGGFIFPMTDHWFWITGQGYP